jgi:hypothetical protein
VYSVVVYIEPFPETSRQVLLSRQLDIGNKANK